MPACSKGTWGDDRLRAGVFDRFVTGGEIVDDLFAGLETVLSLDAGEVGTELVVLGLGPAFEGMVVAFVAVEANPHEEVCRILHRLEWVASDLVEVGGGVFVGAAGGGKEFADEFIDWPIVGDLLADPVAEGPDTLVAEELSIAL